MSPLPVPDDLRRFIFTSIASVPHLEALLLLRTASDKDWDNDAVARRLYIPDRIARKVLDDLTTIGALRATELALGVCYRYGPNSNELGQLIDRLAEAYSTNLVGITRLIHSQLDRHAQQFADAFTWKKDT